jgi:hypothetical protein
MPKSPRATPPQCDAWGSQFGRAYEPGLIASEFSSKGLTSQIYCAKTERTHVYFSKIEADYHFVCECNPAVRDIREQYPIVPVSDSIAIAKEIGVPHPRKGGKPIPLTVDFVLTVVHGDSTRFTARSVKTAKDLQKSKVLARQELERRVCLSRGWSWKLVTDKDLPPVTTANARWVCSWNGIDEQGAIAPKFVAELLKVIQEQDLEQPLIAILRNCEKRLSLRDGEGSYLFRYGIWSGLIKIDWSQPLEMIRPHPWLKRNFA